MAKQAGLGDNFYLSGYDLSGDVGAVQTVRSSVNPLGVTGIDKSAHERINGQYDGEISFNSFFNDAVLAEHVALKGRPTTDILASYFRGTTLGNESACLTGKQINYDPNRTADGGLIFGIQVLSNAYGLEWGKMLTAGKRTDTTATSPATGVDFTDTSTAFGMAAYLHIFSFTGTTITITVQDSADNSAFANITGLANIYGGGAPGVSGGRTETDNLTRTVRRYLRVITTGTFSECTFAVVAVRYYAAGRAL